MIPSTVVGSVLGTGAAINVVLGFKPAFVELFNDASGAQLVKFQASLNTFKTVAAGTITTLTGTAGIADYSTTTGTTPGDGFTIPADAQVNVNTQQIRYVAHRSGPGSS